MMHTVVNVLYPTNFLSTFETVMKEFLTVGLVNTTIKE